MPKDILECYRVLDVEPGADAARVRRAYLELMGVWDPDKHVGVPALRVRVEKKRAEIEGAYKAISHFLPELRGDYDPEQNVNAQNRDFNEMSRKPPTEVSKTLTALVLGSVILLIFALGYNLYRQTLDLPAASAPVVDPESVPPVHAP